MANEVIRKDSSELDGTNITAVREWTRKADYLWQYVNNLDVSVTVEVYGSHADDDNFTDGVKLGSTTVASGGGTDFDSMSIDSWDQIQIHVSFGSNPSSGTFDLYEMHNGD